MDGHDGCQLPRITSKPVYDMCRWGQSQKLGIPDDPDDPFGNLSLQGLTLNVQRSTSMSNGIQWPRVVWASNSNL